MNKAKLFIIPFIGLFLCSCENYSSHYKALMMVSTQHKDHGSIRFMEFEGQYVFNFKKTSAGEGAIYYSASLETGSVDVTYVALGTESLLFTIKSGQTFNTYGGYVEKGQKVKVIVRSNAKAINGDFNFRIE